MANKIPSPRYLSNTSLNQAFNFFLFLFMMMVLSVVIDEEWQKTQCVPRETCVEVAKELGTTTNKFFKPPCVNVFRCGGCCNEESLSCMNTSTTYVSKTVTRLFIFFLFSYLETRRDKRMLGLSKAAMELLVPKSHSLHFHNHKKILNFYLLKVNTTLGKII